MLAALLHPASAGAQDLLTGTPEVLVTPVSPTWTYPVGAPASFTVAVRRDGHPLAGVAVTVRCGPEMLPPTLTKEITSGADAGGRRGRHDEQRRLPAVHRHRAARRAHLSRPRDGGFDPQTIAPTVTDPADFDAFWSEGKTQLAKIPVEHDA